jgi:single-stranded-DNA-specific exonuclease
MKAEWLIADLNHPEIESISRSTGIDKNIISILYARGVTKESEIIKFLFPELSYLHSPFLLDGVYDAVKRLRAAVASGENIAIFGDSDLDGITSLTIIHSILTKSGCSPLIRYPKAKESYGMTCDIIDEFIRQKITLVITVDSGIRDVEEINYGIKNGIDFIVTDHHEPDEILPDAIIVNPKKSECGYPFKELAGVGVAFKFVQAFLYSYTSGFDVNFVLIYKRASEYELKIIKNGVLTEKINAGKEEIVAALTAKITNSDYIVLLNNESLALAPIIKSMFNEIIITDIKKISSALNNTEYADDETMLNKLAADFQINRKYTPVESDLYYKIFIEMQWRSSKKILDALREYVVLVTIGTIADIMPLHGENRLLIKYGLSLINQGKGHPGIISLAGKSNTTSKSISWDIAPLLNAPGRMGETDLTVNFFLEQDCLKNAEIVSAIQKINRERKKIVLEIIEKIKNDHSGQTFNDNIFFYMHDEIIDGLAGLIANRLADDLKKPAIIATGSDKNGIVKGSARSSGNFDFFKYTAPVAHLFERVGGHAQAFGFTAEKTNIREIIDTINELIADNFIPEKSVHIDSIIEMNDINSNFIKKLSLLEPFGKCNEEPLFAVKRIKIEGFSSFGNLGNHGKFIINRIIQAIGWNMFDKMNSYYTAKKDVDLIFKLENNEYMGKTYPRMILVDMDFSD